VAFSTTVEDKKSPVLKIFQKLEDQPFKPPEDPEKQVKTPGPFENSNIIHSRTHRFEVKPSG
jgi:hypothetical protein